MYDAAERLRKKKEDDLRRQEKKERRAKALYVNVGDPVRCPPPAPGSDVILNNGGILPNPDSRTTSTGSFVLLVNGWEFKIKDGLDAREREDPETVSRQGSEDRLGPASNYTHLHIAQHATVRHNIHWKDLEIPVDSDVLGQGSQATVKKVLHKPTGTYFAMKIINALNTPKKQLYAELAAIYSSCNANPYLLPSYDAFFRDFKIYVLMEYMRYGSLADVLHICKRMTEEEAAIASYHVLQGLSALHSVRCIHRDIKPSNLLVNEGGIVKVADFGIATFADSLNLGHTAIGTKSFMSPERISNGAHSFESDIWSFGLTIAQCVLGYFPLDCSTCAGDFEFTLKVVQGNVRVLFKPELGVSEEFQRFVLRCVVHKWEDRPKADELLQDPFILMHKPQGKTVQSMLRRYDEIKNQSIVRDA